MVQVQAPRTIRYIFVNLTCHYFMLYLCLETFYFYFYSDPRHLIFEKNCRKPRNIKSLALWIDRRCRKITHFINYSFVVTNTNQVKLVIVLIGQWANLLVIQTNCIIVVDGLVNRATTIFGKCIIAKIWVILMLFLVSQMIRSLRLKIIFCFRTICL